MTPSPKSPTTTDNAPTTDDNGNSDEPDYMALAIGLAHTAAAHDDVPVGALIVHNNQIIGRGENRRELDKDPTAHAEIIAIRQAAKHLNTWHLVGTTLYVTQEPCPMCAGAIVNARIARLIYGCHNPKAGAVRTLYNLLDDPRLNHRVQVQQHPSSEECGALLTNFFRRLRTPPP